MLLATCTYAQRNCGTMEYLELRKKQDPAVEQRMIDGERKMSEWMKQHPLESDFVKLPELPGYKPTGNLTVDRVNYAKAKEKYLAENPGATRASGATPGKAVSREAKKKQNNYIVR